MATCGSAAPTADANKEEIIMGADFTLHRTARQLLTVVEITFAGPHDRQSQEMDSAIPTRLPR
jgi:hypothetical protein